MADTSNLVQYNRILAALRSLRHSEERNNTLRGVLLAGSALMLLGFVVSALEAIAWFGIEGRTILFAVSMLSAVAAIILLAGPALRDRFSASRRKSDDTVALQVGSHFPHVRDRLLDAMQVYRSMNAEAVPTFSPALVDAGFRDVADNFETLNLASVLDTKPLRTALRLGAGVLLFCTAFALLLPSSLFMAAGRILQFRTDFAPPAPFEFHVTPGDVDAVKGERIELTATTTSRLRQEISFFLRQDAQETFDQVAAVRDSSGRSVYVIEGLRGSLTYYAEAAGYRSRQYTINVVDRPYVRSLRVKLTFPSYTRIPPKYLDENVGDITGLPGTRVSVEMALNKEVREAALMFADSAEVALRQQGLKAAGEFTLRKDNSWHVRLIDDAGIPNASPIEYMIKVTTDAPPTVEIVEPGANVNIDESMRLRMGIRIGDDYGFSKLVLKYRLAASRYERPHENYTSIPIPLPSARELDMQVPYIWNLTSLNLVPEDVVSYYVEVYDNDIVNGPKVGRSQVYSLRLPSLEEVFARADSEQNKAIEDLQETAKAAQEVQREMEKLQQELKQQNAEKLSWQQQKKVEELMQRQDQLVKEVQKVNEQMSELKQDMQKQNILSEETLKKYEELEQLMREVDAPELRENMKRMNEMMKQMTPEQMREAMEKFTLNEENFRRSIDRTIDLLKRLQIEQKVDELTKRAQDLADKQEDLANRTEKADPSNQQELDKLAQEQRELQKEMDAMQREMAELQKKMEEFPQEMPLNEMQDAQSEMNLSQMQQQMSNSASMCEGGNCQGASKQQKQTAEQLRKVQKKMDKVKKKMNSEMQKMVQRGFQKALKETLELSKKQEDLKNRVANLPENSPQYREALREQAQLMEQLDQTGNELMELAKKTFAVNQQMAEHLGKAMQQMKQSMQSMQNRDKRTGGQQQGGAMAELNEAARQISKGMQSSSQSGSSQGGSMMQQLRQAAQQQMSINQGMPMPQQGGMSQQQMQQMQRLMVQQQAVQKTVEELNKEAKKSEEGKRILGDLERVAQEMQEVVHDMQQSNVNPNTIQKQERILSRLLDASRSTRERDWEKQRRSRTGQDVARRGPGQIDPSLLNPEKGLQRDLQRAVNEGYSRDYEALIRKYFEKVGTE
jgi:hypothetical protein